MSTRFTLQTIVVALAVLSASLALAQDRPIGSTAASLLDYAAQNNPEFAAMRHEADAAGERVTPAGALPDPRFRIELMDLTRMGEQNATLSPSRVGSTKYTITQELPWYGKRDLKREIAEFEADGAAGRTRGAWADIARA